MLAFTDDAVNWGRYVVLQHDRAATVPGTLYIEMDDQLRSCYTVSPHAEIVGSMLQLEFNDQAAQHLGCGSLAIYLSSQVSYIPAIRAWLAGLSDDPPL